jgi:hypothetical protein
MTPSPKKLNQRASIATMDALFFGEFTAQAQGDMDSAPEESFSSSAG